MTDEQNKIKMSFQAIFKALIKKHEITSCGETMLHDICRVDDVVTNNIIIYFEDEEIGYLIAGYVAGLIYDEMESNINLLGYDIIDTDGSNMHVCPLRLT